MYVCYVCVCVRVYVYACKKMEIHTHIEYAIIYIYIFIYTLPVLTYSSGAFQLFERCDLGADGWSTRDLNKGWTKAWRDRMGFSGRV